MTSFSFSFPAEFHLDELIPSAHAVWRPLVRDALAFFVGQLPRARKIELVADQTRLPAGTPAPVRLAALLKQCPTLHKLGQVLARDERLTPELRAQLRQLESFPATTAVSRLMPDIQRAIGNTPGVTVSARALAEASVAVVVPITWRAGARKKAISGVVKVLKPGIRTRLEQELSAWSELGAFIEERCQFYGLPELDYRDIIKGVAGRLRHEVELEREQTHIREAARLYEGMSGVRVPALFPFCSADVTAMSRIRGVKLTDVSPGARRRAMRSMVDALLVRPLLSADSGVPFHADPHPGNLIVERDGTLALVDWSLVARLHQQERRALGQILLSALGFDETGIRQGLNELSAIRSSGGKLGGICADAVRQLRWGTRPGLRWMTGLLDRAVTETRMSVSKDLVLFRKALHTISGISEELSTSDAVDEALLQSGLRRYLGDSMVAIADPSSPGDWSAVHAANAALVRLWCGAPAAATRFWLGAWRDLTATART